MPRPLSYRKLPVLNYYFFLVALILLTTAFTHAQAPRQSEPLFSPSAGQRFCEIASDLVGSNTVTGPQAEQAVIFLTAARNVGAPVQDILPEMINTICLHCRKNHFKLVHTLLSEYIDESADLVVAQRALDYLLDRLDTREQRESFLAGLFQNIGKKNPAFDSELAAMIGRLVAEKPNPKAAEFYFMQAYSNNKYNLYAFQMLDKLTNHKLHPTIYIEQLRRTLQKNPLNLQNALDFAGYAEKLQLYNTATEAYEYCAKLFNYLHPRQNLPASIYLPWALSAYNSPRKQQKCLEIAAQIEKQQRFDLLLKAIAAKAAQKIGDEDRAQNILKSAQKRAENLLKNKSTANQLLPQELAWFYCFALPNTENALDWANKAYSAEPDSPSAGALLAYALILNHQTEPAQSLIENQTQTQISTLVKAHVQIKNNQKDAAIETLQDAVARDPGSFAAEQAKQLLTQLDAVYLPPTDPNITLTMLQNNFPHNIVPQFLTPDKILSVQLNLRGSKFSYSSDLDGNIAVKNLGPEPLVIGENCLFQGNISINADITGDLNRHIKNLVSIKIRPPEPIQPATSILVPVKLAAGKLRRILLDYPQASLKIEFTVFADPQNPLPGLKPKTLLVKRTATQLTTRFLRNRFNSLSQGLQGQKIRTTKLFVGLLAEQYRMADRKPLYKFRYADWMPEMLTSALVNNLTNADWVLKTHTMAWMLTLPAHYELLSAISENLNNPHWPARLMALYLLSHSQTADFDRVLQYTAEYDPHQLVRQMAAALQTNTHPQNSTSQKPATQSDNTTRH